MKPRAIHLRVKQLSLDAAAGAGAASNPLRAASDIALTLGGGALHGRGAATGWQHAVGLAVSQRLVAMGVLTPEQLAAAVAEGRTEP